MERRRLRPAQVLPRLSGASQTRSHTLARDLPFELREHREQTRHRATCGRGEFERFGKRYETHSEMRKFLWRGCQVCDGGPSDPNATPSTSISHLRAVAN